MQDSRNFLLAIALSLGVLLLWQSFIGGPSLEEERQRQTAEQERVSDPARPAADPGIPTIEDAIPDLTQPAPATIAADDRPAGRLSHEAALRANPRISFDAPSIDGSISLVGARFDDVRLKHYRETTDPDSPEITLLSPREAASAYYAEFGWTAAGTARPPLPDARTEWRVEGNRMLTPETPVTLVWDNGEGLTFRQVITVDEHYMFTVTQEVTNETGRDITLAPYALIARHGVPETQDFFILHEGMIGVFNGTLEEKSYKRLREDTSFRTQSTGGWLGITDKYWLAALAPAQSEPFQGRFVHRTAEGQEIFQSDYLLGVRTIPAGGTVRVTNHLFAGAKVRSIIDGYETRLGINRFDLAIDWGFMFFLTKPIFLALEFLGNATGNFGIAILLFTVLVKLLFFPLANKSYEAMTKMKKVQPEMLRIRDRYKDDKMRQQQELMALYKKEKINPLAGCLPIFIQIPVFFALYKVLFVTIEMRHAPFFGWIDDLSAPDPTSLFNLFGLLPWDPSMVPMIGGFLMIGIWPVFMGLTMWFQFKLNPTPPEPIQQKIFTFMPLVFTIILAQFAAGLVIYWAWNNFLSILQQYVIMRRMGVDIEWGEKFRLPGFIARYLPASATPAAGTTSAEGEGATAGPTPAAGARTSAAQNGDDAQEGDDDTAGPPETPRPTPTARPKPKSSKRRGKGGGRNR